MSEQPPKKVIYLLTTLWMAGTERNAAMFCEHIDRQRFLPEVWYLHETSPSLKGRIEAAGIEVKCLNAPRRKSPAFGLHLARKLARTECDLFHAFLPSITYYLVLSKALFRCRTPALFSSGSAAVQLPLQKQMYRWGIGRYCYPVICNSESVRQFLCSSGIPGDHLRIIPNGHDATLFQETGDPNTTLQELGLQPDVPVILSVGRFIDSKRPGDLLQALRLLRDRGVAVQALLVGEGPLRSEMESLARELGIDAAIHFAGNRSDVPQLLSASACFAFPSENEGLPNAVIEAALARVPIAACRAPGVVDVVTHEQTGLLSSPRDPVGLADSIARLLDDGPLAKRLTDAAFAEAHERFDISRIIPQLHQAYEDALNWKGN